MKANQKFREFVEDDNGIVFEMLIGAVFALIIGYAAMVIGSYINGTIADSLIKSFPTAVTSRTAVQNMTFNNLKNLTGDYGSNSKMVSTAYLITIITLPLIAVVAVKKLM